MATHSSILAWRIPWTIHGVAKTQTRLSDFDFHSFRIDWLDLLAVQGTLKSLLQHHSSIASLLWRSAFFMVQSYL